jgi:hypothetical protein
VLGTTAAAFALLVALGIHGYSLPAWHAVIDGSRAPELLAGAARGLRTDDWAVGLPLALAQAHHDPPFPRVNRDIGLGQDLILMGVPIAHPITLFRPATWGFFVSDDTGVAWMWWSQLLGAFAAWFLALRAVAPGRDGLAALGSLVLVASPFLQFWSLTPARPVAWTGLALAGAAGVLRAPTQRGVVGHALLLAVAACGFAVELYPPFQVPLAWLGLAATAGLAVELRGRGRLGLRLAALAGAGAAALLVCLAFWFDAAGAIERMRATTYPGERVERGGWLPAWQLFAHDLGAGLAVGDWSPAINLAEGAGFWLLFPVLAAGFLKERRRDPVAAALLAVIALLAAHACLGLPTLLRDATLLSQVAPQRAVVGIGLADLMLLVRWLAREGPAPGPRFAAGAAVAWGAGLAAFALAVHRALPDSRLGVLLGFAAVNAGLAFAVLRRERPGWVLAALALAVAGCTLWWNPLVRGGSAYLVDNPLSRRIRAIDRAAGGDTLWVSYGPPHHGNLFRVLGVRALTGVQPLPQLELWQRLDPAGRFERVYNRYAWFTARSAGAPGVSFRLAAPDAVELVVDPAAPELRALGVTHVLIVAPDPRAADALPGIERIFSLGRNHVYRLVGPGPPSSSSRAAQPSWRVSWPMSK